MNIRTTLGIAGLLALCALAGVLALAAPAGTSFKPGVTLANVYKQAHVDEDDPRWNGRVQGNRICGPTQPMAGER
jgi:hypothetical protein